MPTLGEISNTLEKAKEGEIRTIGGKRKIYRPWGEWEEVTPGEEAWQKAGGIAPPEWKPIVTTEPPEWKPIVTTEKTTPTTPTELYDIGKIQTDLTTASTSKKAAYNELIGLQSKQYDTEYNKAGLGDLKTKVAGIDSDITDEKRVRDESIDKVRRNPYYSAAIITGEVAEIERTSNARLNRLIDQRNSIAGQFNGGIDNITRKVGYATSDAQTKYSYWESEEKRLSGLVSTYQTELRRQLERKEAAPSVFGTAETGYRQWDPMAKTWKEIIPPITKAEEPKTTTIGNAPQDVETYARQLLRGEITESGVPAKIRPQTIRRRDELRKTEITWTDEEIRAWIRSQLNAENIRVLPTNEEKKSRIRDSILLDRTLTDADRKRFNLILNEVLPAPAPVKKKAGIIKRMRDWFKGLF